MFFDRQPRRSPRAQLYPSDMLLTAAKMRTITRAVRGDTSWLVHFFTQSSLGCENLSKSLRQIRSKLNGLVRVAAVDCDAQQALCEAQQVSDLPLVKLLSVAPGVRQFTAAADLSEKALTSSVLDSIPSHVIDLRRPAHEAQFYDMCKKQLKRGCVLLFTDKYDTTPLYKKLSSTFKGKLLLGIVRGAHNSELAKRLGVQSFPTLQYRDNSGSRPITYDGPVNFNQIKTFLQQRVQ